MGPNNGIVGDAMGIDLPEMEVEPGFLNDEKKLAKFSRTAEFKRLKDYIDTRVIFYQTCLPDGRPVAGVSKQERIDAWDGANLVIMELTNILGQYDAAAEAVKDNG